MKPSKSWGSTYPSFFILGGLVILLVLTTEILLSTFLHIELHPLDNHLLLVGFTTASLAALLILLFFLRTSIFSQKIEGKDFFLKGDKETPFRT